MDLEDLEKRIDNNTSKLEELTKQIDESFSNIKENREKIQHNTGALALLHTINSNSNKYFIIWIITFISLILSVGYNIFLLTR